MASNGASLVAQLVKNLPAMQETWVQFLSWEDSLEKGKATDSSVLAWSPWSCKELGMTERLSLYLHTEWYSVLGYTEGPTKVPSSFVC